MVNEYMYVLTTQHACVSMRLKPNNKNLRSIYCYPIYTFSSSLWTLIACVPDFLLTFKDIYLNSATGLISLNMKSKRFAYINLALQEFHTPYLQKLCFLPIRIWNWFNTLILHTYYVLHLVWCVCVEYRHCKIHC